jgi:hypothetical protein
MSDETPAQHPCLAGEVARYLAAVDLFRHEGACPTWAPEHTPDWWAEEHLHPRGGSARLNAPNTP